MSETLVTIPLGKLQGITGKNQNGYTILKFLGVPYAKPPIGDLRFKAPEPVEPWNGVRDCTVDGDISYSRDTIVQGANAKPTGSENCLILNVFTKQIDPSDLKPVMFYIHGGAFTMGSSKTDMLGPELLLTEDIVLVTINYRLGVLGFLNSDDPTLDVPGNAGLKDQNMALKWVQKYIKYFGGDPDNVTIFGESAGSASVQFHMVSPLSKGLFHKAIMQSGNLFQSWAWGAKNNIRFVVEALGKTYSNDKEGLEILRTTSCEELYEAQEKCHDFIILSAMERPFCCIIENPNPTAFITKEPQEIISSGEQNQVPFMLGYTADEGICVNFIVDGMPGFFENFNDGTQIKNLIPIKMNIPKDSKEENEIVKDIQEIYFTDGYSQENIFALYTDALILSGLLETVKLELATNKSPVYMYRMSLESKINFLKNCRNWQHFPGMCHADDLGYLFTSLVNPSITPGSFEEVSYKKVVKLWTNFAKTGNPTPSNEFGVLWKPVTDVRNAEFFNISTELKMLSGPERERAKFWMKFYETYKCF